MVVSGMTGGVIGGGRTMDPEEAASLSPLVLAYVGDAVYELYVRARLLAPGVPVDALHQRCVRWVSAQGQEKVWEAVRDLLRPEEREVARRARNAKATAPRTATVAAYRRATALEAVVGYLHLTGQESRIEELLGPVLRRSPGESPVE